MSDDVPAPGRADNFSPDEVIIYGIKLNTPTQGAKLNLSEGEWDILISGLWAGGGVAPANFQIVAAYGYAFEGHCYRFDRTRILGFPAGGPYPDGESQDLGCGFDQRPGSHNPPTGFKMWRLKSLDRIIELSASVDTVQKIILDANLPGKRAPQTYRGEMQLAHRGGRLTSS